MKALKGALAVIALLAVTSCGDRDPSFSLLEETDVFYQSSSSFSNKLDILWVVDNSDSMAANQANLAANFDAFIQDFSTRGYDFQIAVTTTDAWPADPYFSVYSWYDLGDADFVGSIPILTPSTPNLENEFINNVVVGVGGFGDERAFQSMAASLTSPNNAGFIREGGFLAVIIVSDEDDFSADRVSSIGENYSHSQIHPVADYVTLLDGLTSSTGPQRRYSVSSISIKDSGCLAANTPYGNIAVRYHELVDLTDGVNGDICNSSFASELDAIQEKIAELSTQFFLSREPVVSSIKVKVNGNSIPQDPDNGWSYNPSANSIVFHGSAIPPQGAKISIDFDPKTVVQ